MPVLEEALRNAVARGWMHRTVWRCAAQAGQGGHRAFCPSDPTGCRAVEEPVSRARNRASATHQASQPPSTTTVVPVM
jgi:hypothetical protein